MKVPAKMTVDFRLRYPGPGSLRQYFIFGNLTGCVMAVRGGDLALLMIEVYDDRFELFWRYSPDLDQFQREFASELAAEVVPPGPWEDLPFQKEAQIIARAVPASLGVADDVGTRYVAGGHREAIGGLPVEGTTVFNPSIAVAARSVEVSALGATFAITLRSF